MPIIVAEALIDLVDPLASVLSIGPDAPLEQVLASLAKGVAPIEARCPVPAWLREEQVAPFRRAVAAIERYRGVLLADPVGSGKTYVALAVASALGLPTVAVVPASLREQWRRISGELGVALEIHTHEAMSRGRSPDPRARFVIVDESHRFRTPGIRRYRELARWLVGRRILLLSGTPVVNRLSDLAHQLRLGIRDDALAMSGVPTIPAMLESGAVNSALGDVVLCRAAPAGKPRALPAEIHWTPAESDSDTLKALDTLRASGDRGLAALIRIVFWRALASSRQALMRALERYARLLHHAAQASASGRAVTRAEIRTFTDGALDQLVMWEVLPTLSDTADLVLDDLPSVNLLVERLKAAGTDPRVRALRRLLSDNRPTLVFTASRDTLDALRAALDDLRPAWVNGAAAGIGHTRMDRETVLDLLRPKERRAIERATPAPRTQTILLATDVAAEGLNLQLAERVVHFDLPWTSVRVDQREGRAIRLGSTCPEVEVVHLAPWPALEERLHRFERLVSKRRLTTQAGLDDAGRWLYRWRAELSETIDQVGTMGFAVARGPRDGWLAGLALDLQFPDGGRQPMAGGLIWIEPDGTVVEDPRWVVERLLELRRAEPVPATREDRQDATRQILAASRARIQTAMHSSLHALEASPEQRRLVRRMRRIASDAARERNRRMLDLADRALDWLSGGVTAGEAALIADLNHIPVSRLAGAWQLLLGEPRARPVPIPRLTGVIRVTSFPACQTSAPCCSTSTAP